MTAHRVAGPLALGVGKRLSGTCLALPLPWPRLGLKAAMWPKGVLGCLSGGNLLLHVALSAVYVPVLCQRDAQGPLSRAAALLLMAGRAGCTVFMLVTISLPTCHLQPRGAVQMDKSITYPFSASTASASCLHLPVFFLPVVFFPVHSAISKVRAYRSKLREPEAPQADPASGSRFCRIHRHPHSVSFSFL